MLKVERAAAPVMGIDEAVVPAAVRQVPAVVRRVPAVVRRVPAVVRRVPAVVRWVPAVVRRVLAVVCWVPAAVRRVLAVVRRVLVVVRWVPAAVRWVPAAVRWVQQLSHEDQKHHKGKTRNFYLQFCRLRVIFHLGNKFPFLFVLLRSFISLFLSSSFLLFLLLLLLLLSFPLFFLLSLLPVLFCFYQISWWGRKERMKLFFLVKSIEFLYKLQKQANAAKLVDVETEVTDDPDELQRFN